MVREAGMHAMIKTNKNFLLIFLILMIFFLFRSLWVPVRKGHSLLFVTVGAHVIPWCILVINRHYG